MLRILTLVASIFLFSQTAFAGYKTTYNPNTGVSDYVGVNASSDVALVCDSGNVLTTTGSGTWACGTVTGGSGSPGGLDTYVQYNDAGSFGGDAGMTYNKTTDALTIGGTFTGGIIQSRRASGLTNFSLYSTTNAAEEWILYLSGEDMRFYEAGGGGDRFTFKKGGLLGVLTTAPDAAVEINHATGDNLRLTYNDSDGSATNYADFSTSSSGDLTIAPSGGDTTFGDGTNNVNLNGTSGTTYAGTARPTASIYLPITSGTCRTTNGCADPVKSETATNFVTYYSSSFAADADDFWQAAIKLPANYDAGTFTARFEWTGTTEASATVVWGAQMVCLSDDDALDTAFGTAQTASDDVTVTGDYQVTSETSAITAGGTCAAGDRMWVQIYRDPDNASDDATNPAKLIGVYLTYTRISESTND